MNNCTTCHRDQPAHDATLKSANGTKCACSHGARYHQIIKGRRLNCSQCECSRHHYKLAN